QPDHRRPDTQPDHRRPDTQPDHRQGQTRVRGCYVHPKPQQDYDNESEASEIGDIGENIVKIYEEHSKKGCTVTKMPKNNKGYDIKLEFENNVTRYIEVKAIKGPWGFRGVSVSYDQYEFARNLKPGESWWLYIVEYAKDSQNLPVLHIIENPFIKESGSHITEFRFDDGWREVASSDLFCCFVPGAIIEDPVNGKGKIDELQIAGESRKLIVDYERGGRKPIPLNLNIIKLIRLR
ncbi:MAG: DUF3883 domain-containing protein, partial [Candidatus Contendobacter sp.]